MRTRPALVLAVVALALTAASAAAEDELADPCGLDKPRVDSSLSHDGPIPWLDFCGGHVGGVPGAGDLRAVEFVFDLDAAVPPLQGARYTATFRTERCAAHIQFRVYPGLSHPTVRDVRGTCDTRPAPCEPPHEGLPFVYCSTTETFDVRDAEAVTAALSGKHVELTFDPNLLPSGATPGGLAHDLGPSPSANGTPVYSPLERAWVSSTYHFGIKDTDSTSIGVVGDGAASPGPVSLD